MAATSPIMTELQLEPSQMTTIRDNSQNYVQASLTKALKKAGIADALGLKFNLDYFDDQGYVLAHAIDTVDDSDDLQRTIKHEGTNRQARIVSLPEAVVEQLGLDYQAIRLRETEPAEVFVWAAPDHGVIAFEPLREVAIDVDDLPTTA